MSHVWIYTVNSSSDPDNVGCVVPYQLDEDLIFFGPCKTRIRERIRREFLSEDCSHCRVTDDLFIAGVNAANSEKCRKFVWAGKLSEVMTFAEADRRLSGPRFEALRNHEFSPLHVRPLWQNRNLVGYEHISKEHIDDKLWVSDLVSNRRGIRIEGNRLMLRHGWSRWDAFDRDCCMLLENSFFAQGQGVEFDEAALRILKESQPGSSRINGYAVFGCAANGYAKGLRGHYLKIDDNKLANRFVEWLKSRTRLTTAHLLGNAAGPTKRRCTVIPSRRRNRKIRCA